MGHSARKLGCVPCPLQLIGQLETTSPMILFAELFTPQNYKSRSFSSSVALTRRFVEGEKNFGDIPSTSKLPLSSSRASRVYRSWRSLSPQPFAAFSAITAMTARVIRSRFLPRSPLRSMASKLWRKCLAASISLLSALSHCAADASA